jgi:hypothetical protein
MAGIPIWKLEAWSWMHARGSKPPEHLHVGLLHPNPMHGAFGCVRARQQEGKDLWTAACRSAPIFSSAYPLRQMLT